MERYIEGKEIPPYQEYLNHFGLEYIDPKRKFDSYGNVNWAYDKKANYYYVSKYNKSTFKTEVGDTILTINGEPLDGTVWNPELYYKRFFPEKNEEMLITVKRNGKVIELLGKAKRKQKVHYAYLLVKQNRTEEQKQKYRQFLYKDKD